MSWVLFFDGDCAFCSKSVQQVARFDQNSRISFAPLQGKLAQKSGFQKYISENGGSMVLLRESDGKIFTHSDSWIELCHALGGFWKIVALIRFIPKSLRDLVYRWFARNRYQLMGKTDACMLPSPELLKRLRD
jgi:predicted DCC family thiol-disulfide oxidoreductase YuxK